MTVADCPLPPQTAIDPRLVAGAAFVDAQQVALRRGSATTVDLFFAVFGHHPAWLKALLLLRHRVGAWCGLQGAATAEIVSPRRAARYSVGQRIGPWPIYHLGDHELVAGRDNRHLDFRVSVLRRAGGQGAWAVVSTVCVTHNTVGRLYLRAIAPLHRWGMRRLLQRASAAGRL